MKPLSHLIRLMLLVGMAVGLADCDRGPFDLFEGRVVNYKNEGIEGATVEINGQTGQSGKDGRFALKIKRTKGESTVYQVNVRSNGYSTYSQRHSPSSELNLTLYEATVTSVDPTQEITVTDTNSRNRPGPAAARADWKSNPRTAVPLVVRDGKIIDLGFPPQMEQAFNYLITRKPGLGISVTIPANSLVNASTQAAPTANVNVAISTIDLFSPRAMPGDFGVGQEGRERGYLISYGAGFIDVFDNQGHYQLKKGATAKITIPVDESQRVLGDSLPPSIPLYLFDETAGLWVDHGKASLNDERSAYTGEVRHFSTFNLDIEKDDPACLAFQYIPQSPAPANFTYKVEALVPVGMNIVQRSRTVNEPGDCPSGSLNTGIHALIRLPQAADVGLVFFDASDKPLSIIISQTSPRYDPASPPVCTPAGYETTGGAVSCPSVTWDQLTTPLIGGGFGTTLKWVDAAATGAASYRAVEADATCAATSTVITPSATSTSVLGLSGLTLNTWTITVPTTSRVKVQAMDAMNNVIGESNCIVF